MRSLHCFMRHLVQCSQVCVLVGIANIAINFYTYVYYVDHTCTFPGCSSVLVIDGNMKNTRDICAANEAGFLKFDGLPNVIKTDCQLTPAYQSKYCYEHAPKVRYFDRSADHPEKFCSLEPTQVITSKKQTRNGTYYQVNVYAVHCFSKAIIFCY